MAGEFYDPTPDDLNVMRRAFPGDEPGNPSWAKVVRRLTEAGYHIDALRDKTAPELVRLLSQVVTGQSN